MPPSLSWMDGPWRTEDRWPEDGWPYPDESTDPVVLDFDADADDDLVSVHALQGHLLDTLDPIERAVVVARFGLDGRPAQSMKQLQHDLGMSRADLRVTLGAGLAKLRTNLA